MPSYEGAFLPIVWSSKGQGEALPRIPFSPAGRRCRQADEGAERQSRECAALKQRAKMTGVPCGPLIRPFGPPSPRWGEGKR
ncbi:hypothetical protein B5K08_12520 [Rhizobium leguminosarum bv. trifolii]|uniref:Uncharacterized protein n=1 Tax=Rhizobium leguminosarum bv. trifolii TaxID=386 RepID=A0A3E1BM14_RHILT|nr:hypothetical protein B5K08_12520 [Rhizobium leguminosarum bv. trifolii]RFB94315.1 hypothetical protein B5K10_12510 [Rhizobium leguminosarum bv. trifolii]